jgi:endonuclease/exonuclease/phosphatase family metal-dependent hydrolase
MRLRGRVWYAVVVLLVITAMATSGCKDHKNPDPVPSSEPPPPGLPRIDVLQYNIAGGGKANHGEYEVMDRLAERIGRARPDVISLNEVCERQYLHLVDRLKEIGYAMHGSFAPTRRFIDSCWKKDAPGGAGNAVLVRGAVTENTWYTFGDKEHYSEKGKPAVLDLRGGVCLRVRLARRQTSVRVCNAHLAEDGKRAAVQFSELARVFGPMAQREPFILAGDMNLDPSNPAMGAIYAPYETDTGHPLGNGQFYEVDAWLDAIESYKGGSDGMFEPFRSGQPTVGGNRKLDYIFASKSYFHSWTLAKAADPGKCLADEVLVPSGQPLPTTPVTRPCSDHLQLWGRLFLAGIPLGTGCKGKGIQGDPCSTLNIPD